MEDFVMLRYKTNIRLNPLYPVFCAILTPQAAIEWIFYIKSVRK